MPKTLGGEPVKYIILDDESKPDNAAKNARKFVTEDKVDAIMGSNGVPSAVAMSAVAAEAKTPMIALTPVPPLAPDRLHWTFVVPQTTELMMSAVVEHMKANGVKTMGYIGFADAYGDGWLAEMKRSAQTAGIQVTAEEKYNRADTSVTGQVLKLIAAKPDAILIGAAGTPGATPQKELVARGYKGKIYQTHGVANPDFLRVVGADGNGTLLPAGPMLVFEQLPDSNPVKKVAAEYVTQYEKKFGTRSTFGGHAYDAYLLLNGAIPGALKKGKPGTKEFRAALRDELEKANVVGTHGVFVMTPHDHNGLDNRARVMVRIENDKWVLVK